MSGLDPNNLQALKVTDLKAELKKRGLPVAGLKQVLIDRLREVLLKEQEPADETPADETPAAEEPPQESEPEPVQDAPQAQDDAPSPSEPTPALEDPEPEQLEEVEKVQVAPGTVEVVAEVPEETPKPVEEELPEAPQPVIESPEEDAQPQAEDESPEENEPVPEPEPELPPVPLTAEQDKPKTEPETVKTVSMDIDAAEQEPTIAEEQTKDAIATAPEPVTVVTETTTTKAEENGDTVMTETTVVYAENAQEAQPEAMTIKTEVMDESTDRNALLKRKRRSVSPAPPADQTAHSSPPSTKKQRQESPPRRQAPAKDARFKGLFNDTAMPDARDADAPENLDDDEAPVEPSIHPATRALYIRNFIRPLLEPTVRNHILQLASRSAGADDNENGAMEDGLIETFFLDSIKSHALIVFSNLTAATRVRVGIHGKIFPNEKQRKPLWADFVPEEKVEGWIAQERERSARWEIAYETIDGELVAELVEAGTSIGGGGALSGRVGPPMQQRRSVDISNAPTGPRRTETIQRRNDNSRMVVRDLDDLFMSTNTKPKLYFLPVSEELARQRIRDGVDNRVVRGRR